MSVISLLPVGNAGLYIELVSYLLILRTFVLLESNGALVSHSPSLLIFSLLPSYGLNPDVIKVLQLALFPTRWNGWNFFSLVFIKNLGQ